MSCSYFRCSSKPAFSCDNCAGLNLFCIQHAESHKFEQNHSMKFSSDIVSTIPRNQSKNRSIREIITNFISESEAIILAVRKISLKKLKKLKRGKDLNRNSFNIERLIKTLSKKGIIDKGSRIYTSEEINSLMLHIQSKEQKINELENKNTELIKDNLKFHELYDHISNMKQKDEKIAEIQGLTSEIKDKNLRIAELETFINDILSENENKQRSNEEFYIKKIKALEFDIKSRDEKIIELNRMKSNLESELKLRENKLIELNRINANQLKSTKDLEKRLNESANQILEINQYLSSLNLPSDSLNLMKTYENQVSVPNRAIRNSAPISKPFQTFNNLKITEKINYIQNNCNFVMDLSNAVECFISNDSKYLFICITYIGKFKQMVTLNKHVKLIIDLNI